MRENKVVLLLALIIILLLVIVILTVHLLQYKRQMRNFTKMTIDRKASNMNKPVTVDYFDKEVIALADALNEYIDMQKDIAIKYENDRKQLKNVIAGISHDFRTPLTATKGYMQLIEKGGNLTEIDREYLGIALEKTSYLKNLSDEFFEVSSLEAREEDIKLESVHLNKLLSESILGQYEWIEKRNLRTNFEIGDKDIFVLSNEHYLNRIIDNLFSNARKYANSSLSLRLILEEKYITIVMENDLENEEMLDVKRVFEPFYRESSRHSDGSGIGLYVVKCLAEQMHYKVSADCIDREFSISVMMKI